MVCFTKVKGSRFCFLRNNQAQLRADEYQGLLDHIQSTQRNPNPANQQNVGQKCILPPTYKGAHVI